MQKSHYRAKTARSGGPVQHTASEFATERATQAHTVSKQAPAPARRDDGTAREAPQTPPQHKI